MVDGEEAEREEANSEAADGELERAASAASDPNPVMLHRPCLGGHGDIEGGHGDIEGCRWRRGKESGQKRHARGSWHVKIN